MLAALLHHSLHRLTGYVLPFLTTQMAAKIASPRFRTLNRTDNIGVIFISALYTSKFQHLSGLLAVRHQFVFVGLDSFHGGNYTKIKKKGKELFSKRFRNGVAVSALYLRHEWRSFTAHRISSRNKDSHFK